MLTQYAMHRAPRAVPALVGVILLACGCSSAGPESQAVDPAAEATPAAGSGGLPTKGDGGLGTKDDGGLGTKDDAGLGTKDDSGLGTNDDSGLGTNDAGPGTEDAGGGVADAGMPVPPDAGGEMNECFACAEQRGCAVQVNTCVHSPACAEEGSCDLACLGSGPFGGLDPHCVQSCSTDWHATQELLAAVACGFRVCPKECLRPLISCEGDAGVPGGPLDPGKPACPFAAAVLPH
jgi:hypothetical protein